MANLKKSIGSVCGRLGTVVVSNTKVPLFESNHQYF